MYIFITANINIAGYKFYLTDKEMPDSKTQHCFDEKLASAAIN